MQEWTRSLRPVCLTDAADLHRNCFPEQSLEEVQSYLRWCLAQVPKGRMVRLIAQVDRQVIANGQLAIHRRDGEIGSLVVAHEHRKQGIGGALLDALISEAWKKGVRTLEVWARSDLSWLQAWYQRRGFVFHANKTLPGGESVVVLRMPGPQSRIETRG